MKALLAIFAFLLSITTAEAQNYAGFLVLYRTQNYGFIEAEMATYRMYSFKRIGRDVRAINLKNGIKFTLKAKGRKWMYVEKGTYRSQGAACAFVSAITLSKLSPRKATLRIASLDRCPPFDSLYTDYKGTLFRL